MQRETKKKETREIKEIMKEHGNRKMKGIKKVGDERESKEVDIKCRKE